MPTDAEGTNKIHLEIVTPRGRMLTALVDEVTAPSVSGEFGVMPGHIPLLAALRTGLVTYKDKGESHKCAIGAGFAEAGPNKLTILTDEYSVRETIDPVIVRKELAEAQSEIAKHASKAVVVGETQDARAGEDGEDLRALIRRENWLAAQLELYGDPPAAIQRPFEEYGPPPPQADDQIPQEDEDGAAKGAS